MVSDAANRAPGWRRYAPLAVVVLALILALAFRIDRYITLEMLERQRVALDLYVDQHYWMALAIYAVLFTIAVTISLPALLVFAVAGGYLFGAWIGGAAAWVSCNVGALFLCLAMRSALGDHFRKFAAPWLARLPGGMGEHAFHYLLTLRLIPPLPFSVLNLAAPFFNVTLREFVIATMIGIIPITFVFATVGAALHQALDTGAALDPAAAVQHLLFSPLMITATLLLIALALLPPAYKAWRKRSAGPEPE